jgi:RNA polymerase sigma-70 factor, ECF subfamily
LNLRSANIDPAKLKSWIERAQQGDIASYQNIYEAFAHKILNFIYRMVHSPQEAEDLTQETFIVVYQKLGTLQDTGKFEPWLFRIARNFVYQRYRTRVPPSVPIDEPDEEGRLGIQLVDARKNPDESFQSQELENVVSAVIAGLPEKYREVFILSAMQNLSYQRIADIVGRSLASVKTDIHRARLEVREKVKNYLKVQNGLQTM